MPPKNILRNINLFVDGRGFAGQVEEYDPPKLTLKTEEYRVGGMDAPVDIDVGMEKIDCMLTLSAIDPGVLKLWGIYEPKVPLTLRAALRDEDGTVTPVEIRLRGKITELDPGTWKAGEKAMLKWTVNCSYYKWTQGTQVLHEIDVENMIRIIDGVDQLASQRSALGI